MPLLKRQVLDLADERGGGSKKKPSIQTRKKLALVSAAVELWGWDNARSSHEYLCQMCFQKPEKSVLGLDV